MESTGPYWTPVHNVLEGSFQVILVNARHMKNVPGRKTDISDSRWIAGLLRHGLLKAAFIPPKFQREWRNLTRMRKNYVHDLSRSKVRVHKLFQESNIKIDSVVSDLFGQSAGNLMQLLLSNESPPSLTEVHDCLRGSLKDEVKARELLRSIQGFFGEHQRYLLTLLLNTIKLLETQIEDLESRIRQVMRSYQPKLQILEEIPGISETSGAEVLAEIGPTVESFSSADALTAWCGLSPGNNQSGGKRFSGRSQVKANHLKTIMVEAAWAAIKTKGSYYKAKYYALKGRLGPKKAIVAVARRMLKAIYHMLKNNVPFKELGEDYLIELNKKARIRYVSHQATQLGFGLVPLEQPATGSATKIFP